MAQSDILNAALDNTKSQFHPRELLYLNYRTVSNNAGCSSASSPLLDCNDFEKICGLQPSGGDSSSVVQNLQLRTMMFWCCHHEVSAAEDIRSSEWVSNFD